MTATSVRLTAERVVIHYFHVWGEPIWFALAKRRRFTRLGIEPARDLTICQLDLTQDGSSCVPPCHGIVQHYEQYLQKYAFRDHRHPGGVSPWRGTPQVLA